MSARTTNQQRPNNHPYEKRTTLRQQQQPSPAAGAATDVSTEALNKAKKQFNEPLTQLHAIFPDWKEEDLISVLEETKGDVETAVARISEGKAEQWGAVKHKREKKPLTPKERETAGSPLRGHGSPRGRGRGLGSGGGGRGGSHGGGPGSRSFPRGDFSTNGRSATPPTPAAAGASVWGKPINGAAAGSSSNAATTNNEHSWDATAGRTADASPAAIEEGDTTVKPADDLKPSSYETSTKLLAGPSLNTTTQAKPQPRKPGDSTRSWAQIAKPPTPPAPQPIKAPTPAVVPTPAPSAPQPPPPPQIQQPPPPPEQDKWEEPTTVEAPTWDDEPPAPEPLATSQLEPETESNDGWVTVAPAKDTPSIPASNSWPSEQQPVHEESTKVEPSITATSAPATTAAPPPGLANPTTAAAPTSKPTTPSVVNRPAFSAHRHSSRFKTTEHAVTMPGQQTQFGSVRERPIQLQFGSLSINGQEPEPSYENETSEAKQPSPEPPVQLLPTSSPVTKNMASTQPPVSPALQQVQAQTSPSASYHQQQSAVAATSSPAASTATHPSLAQQAHVQSQQPVTPSTALAGAGSTPLYNQSQTLSQHGLASLQQQQQLLQLQQQQQQQQQQLQQQQQQQVQAPQPAQAHGHHPSFGQPYHQTQQQQQPFDLAGQVGVGAGQQGAYYRHQGSPFSQQGHGQDYGFGASGAAAAGSTGVGSGGYTPLSAQGLQGTASQGMGAFANPGLSGEYGYESQRGLHDYNQAATAFSGRAGLLGAEDLKALAGANQQPSGPQSAGAQGQTGNQQQQYMNSLAAAGQFPWNYPINPAMNPYFMQQNQYYGVGSHAPPPPHGPPHAAQMNPGYAQQFKYPMYGGHGTPPHSGSAMNKPPGSASAGGYSSALHHPGAAGYEDVGTGIGTPVSATGYQASPGLGGNDFQKYTQQSMNFLGGGGAAGRGGSAVNAGVNAEAYKAYGTAADKTAGSGVQGQTGVPGGGRGSNAGTVQSQQPQGNNFYQSNNRFANPPPGVNQNTGYPQQGQTGETTYYNTYGRGGFGGWGQ